MAQQNLAHTLYRTSAWWDQVIPSDSQTLMMGEPLSQIPRSATVRCPSPLYAYMPLQFHSSTSSLSHYHLMSLLKLVCSLACLYITPQGCKLVSIKKTLIFSHRNQRFLWKPPLQPRGVIYKHASEHPGFNSDIVLGNYRKKIFLLVIPCTIILNSLFFTLKVHIASIFPSFAVFVIVL